MSILRDCRIRCDLSQKQVAYEVGVKPPTVSQWESGVKKPSSKNLKQLADLYGVTVDYLLGRSDDNALVSTDNLTAIEAKLISDFRSLNRQGKDYILQTMEMAARKYIKVLIFPTWKARDDK